MAKALLAEKKHFADIHAHWTEQKIINLYFPLVILNGEIYYVDSMSNTPKPVVKNYISLVRNIRSGWTQGTFRIDFVKRDAVKFFVENIAGPFIDHVARLVTEKSEYILTKHVPLPMRK